MTFLDILYTIFLGPLQLVFEIIYTIANRFMGHPGLAIIVLSLIMNFLVLPLYKRSDAMQEAARDIENKLHDGVAHIKKTFSGDEQMMILQTYYRQNNYKPTDALNGSVSLLLEIPFFMSAYNFLSHLETIQGVSLGPIENLGVADGLLNIGGISINVLPILMTLINVISSAIYLKGFPLKTKIQLYGMALFFLVFLYTSPSGLVFYWTLNNLFSLVKTIFYKLKNPKKVLAILSSALGILVLVFGSFIYDTPSIKRKLFIVIIGVVLELPVIVGACKAKFNVSKKVEEIENNTKQFILGALFLTILVGLVIPSTLIASSPQEFIDVTYFHNPIWYIIYSLCLAAGTFLVWMGVFYWISSKKGKVLFDRLIWVMCGVMLVNYMFFGTDLGIITANLQFEDGLNFDFTQVGKNALVIVLLVAILYFIACKWRQVVTGILLTGMIALAGMSTMNIMDIHTSVSSVEEQINSSNEGMPHFNLSKDGKNVVVIMLDRAMGVYVPYIMNENPELKEQFDGFTYYSNTISFGAITNIGAPGIFGGYEYTPVEMNKRDSESLVSKHNEALKVMPVLFSENGYEVTVCDASYANYQWVPDLSIYDDYPEINTYITDGAFSSAETKEQQIVTNRRNFFCYSIMKTMPLALQETIYANGSYNMAQNDGEETITYPQVVTSSHTADGINGSYLASYNVLDNLPNMTTLTEKGTNTFLMMTNNTTHNQTLLREPDYEVAQHVDNTQYDAENAHRFTNNDIVLDMSSENQMMHYHVNMATFKELGEWFDYLRENDVYDNTRIILVADHGFPLFHIEDLVHDTTLPGDVNDVNAFFPLLMVKDFDAEGFVESKEFMTNADVPTISVSDIIENPTNPFTGNLITNEEKMAHDQYILTSCEFDVSINNGNVFIPGKWFAVSDDIWDLDNWRLLEEETTMPSGAE